MYFELIYLAGSHTFGDGANGKWARRQVLHFNHHHPPPDSQGEGRESGLWMPLMKCLSIQTKVKSPSSWVWLQYLNGWSIYSLESSIQELATFDPTWLCFALGLAGRKSGAESLTTYEFSAKDQSNNHIFAVWSADLQTILPVLECTPGEATKGTFLAAQSFPRKDAVNSVKEGFKLRDRTTVPRGLTEGGRGSK